ncbi:MAG TPA: ABC transporter permease [Betaproteobacteria bacterium]|nr:ABC transporter permease [Betaproteobacteria bacterium]
MKTWLSHHRQAIVATLARMAQTPFATVFAVIAIGVALSLPAVLYVLLNNAARLAGTLPAQPEISVYMRMDATNAQINDLRQRLKARTDLADFRFVPRDTALVELSKQAGVADISAGLTQNPLPDAWVLTPRKAQPENITRIATALQALPYIDTVKQDSQWAQRLNALLDLGHDFVMLLAVLLGAALVAVSGNTIRLQILTRRAEIEVSQLIGATHRYIRRPFLYFGVLQGLFGGLAAWLVVAVSIDLLDRPVAELSALYHANFHLQSLGLIPGLTLLLSAMLLGGFGAYLTVTRTLFQTDAH